MHLFNVDYLSKITSLVKELFSLKKYKALPRIFGEIIFIAMLPLLLVCLMVLLPLYLYSFFFELLKAPITSLHSIMTTEGKEVKHATQAIIYLFSWPFIFIDYCFLAISSVTISFFYSALVILTYSWSLGGFKFHLFLHECDDISIEVSGKYNISAIIFAIIAIIVLVVMPIIEVVDLLSVYDSVDLFVVYPQFIIKDLFVTFFYSLLFMVYRPKAISLPSIPEDKNQD